METAKKFCVYMDILRAVYPKLNNEFGDTGDFDEIKKGVEENGFAMVRDCSQNATLIKTLKEYFNAECVLLMEKNEVYTGLFDDFKEFYIVGDTEKATQLFTIIETATNELFESVDTITERAQEAWKQVQGKDNKKETGEQ